VEIKLSLTVLFVTGSLDQVSAISPSNCFLQVCMAVRQAARCSLTMGKTLPLFGNHFWREGRVFFKGTCLPNLMDSTMASFTPLRDIRQLVPPTGVGDDHVVQHTVVAVMMYCTSLEFLAVDVG
jgi:hypothetical protein